MTTTHADPLLEAMGIDEWVPRVIATQIPVIPDTNSALYDTISLLRPTASARCLWLVSDEQSWPTVPEEAKAFLRALIQCTNYTLPDMGLGLLSLSQQDIPTSEAQNSLQEQFETLNVQHVVTMVPLDMVDARLIQIPNLQDLLSSKSSRLEAAQKLQDAGILSAY